MASPPPPPPIAPPPPAIDLRNDEITAPASPASTASSSSSCSSSKASDPNQPKMRPKMSKRRRRRVAKSKAKSDGERSARSLSDEFDYQQRQNRAWLHHQVQLPGRGGVSHYAERELRAVFGKGESSCSVACALGVRWLFCCLLGWCWWSALTVYRFCDGWFSVNDSNVNSSRRLFILQILDQ